MKKINLVFLFALLIVSFCSLKHKTKVMIIYSYHPGYEWQAEEDSGIMEVFGRKEYLTDRFSLDTKRHPGNEWKEQAKKEALRHISEFGPDLILVVDDNACRLVATEYIGKETPVVFCGMNADPLEYGFPAENITGVIEREFWKESVDYLTELVPGVRNVVIMLDSSVTAVKSAERIRGLALPEINEVYLTNDYGQWKKKILALQDSTDAIGLFVHSTLSDRLYPGTIDPEEVLHWLVDNSRLPEFAIMDFTVRHGALCGYCESGYEQGKLAAEMAVRILQGESPEQIPIAAPPQGKRMINKERAEQLGIYE